MNKCKQCGELYDGDDCSTCKTVTGLQESSFAPLKFHWRAESDMAELPPAYLECISTGQKLPVAIPMCKFGRDPDCDISIDDISAVSRIHFVITFEQGYFYIMDLGSTNGTIVNGKVLTERIILPDASQIQVGPLDFRFVVYASVDSTGGSENFMDYLVRHATEKGPSTRKENLRKTEDCTLPDEARAMLNKLMAKSDQSDEESAEQTEGVKLAMEILHNNHEDPDWSPAYMQPELDRLNKELSDLVDIVRSTERRIRECEKRIHAVKGLRKGLLAGVDEDLIEACGRALASLGWEVRRSTDSDKQELVLSTDSETVAIARIIWVEPQVVHLDLGKLVISQVAHWCRHRNEPKGLLILNPQSDGKPMIADESVFSDDLHEYAREKNVTLMTTVQLLCLFKEVELSNATSEDLRRTISETKGRLAGYQLEVQSPVAV